MGIKENFQKIIDFQKHKNLEIKINRDVVKQSVEETDFYREYSSFVIGLREKLDYLLINEGYQEVVFRPVENEKAKYFKRAMEDKEFNLEYKIRQTSGGEFAFSHRELEDELEEV